MVGDASGDNTIDSTEQLFEASGGNTIDEVVFLCDLPIMGSDVSVCVHEFESEESSFCDEKEEEEEEGEGLT